MKKLSIIVGLALVMLTAACSKDATSDINPSLKTLLGVNIDNSQSRTYIGEAEADGTYPVLWSAGDKVLVNGEAVAVADEFVGKNNLTLEATAAAEYKLAYPAELIDGDVLTISEVQKFVEGSFAVGSGVLVGYSKTEDIMLKNLYGYLKFTVANAADVNRVTVVANGGEALSGTYAINFEAATIAPLAGKDLIRVTDVVATNGVATVVVAVPAGDYSKGFTVKVADKTNGVMTKSLKAAGATVEAGVVYAMPQLTYAATATETLICSAADLQAFIAAANGGDFSAYVSADGQVKLGADIDLAGVTLGHINSWPTDAVFNGQGFALKNWTAKNGLFYNNYGTVKNLVLDQSCKLTHDFASGASDIRPCGFIAMCNLGLVSGCVNNADITIGNADATISQNCFIGSIVGAESIDMVSTNSNDPDKYSSASASTHHFPEARVENCVNNGNITVNAAKHSSGWLYIGGVLGIYSQHSVASTGGVYNTVNNGNLTVNIGENPQKITIGGIVGSTGKIYEKSKDNKLVYCVIEGCVNNGDVTYNGTSNSNDCFYFGGVVGYNTASLQNVTNNGEVKLALENSSKRVYVGGVASKFAADMSNVHNAGKVTIDNLSIATNLFVGGVAALNANYESRAITVSNCTNSGAMDIRYINGKTSNIYAYVGGILGFVAKNSLWKEEKDGRNINIPNGLVTVSNCENSGEVAVVALGDTASAPMVAGVVGYIEKAGNNHTFTNCVNKGRLDVDGNLGGNTCVAGIAGTNYVGFVNCQSLGDINVTISDSVDSNAILIGGFGSRVGNDSNLAWDGCVLDCNFTFTQSSGVVFGLLQADTWIKSNTITVGANEPLKIKKTTTVNGVAVGEAYIAQHSNLLGRDQMVIRGDISETHFVIAEGGVVLE